VKDNDGDLPADSHNNLNGWKNYLPQLLHMLKVSNVRQIEVHRTEPLVAGPSRIKVEISIEKLKKDKSPGSNQIPAELIQAGGEMLLFAIHNSLILLQMRKKVEGVYYCTNLQKGR
jgi:hypothetical protein